MKKISKRKLLKYFLFLIIVTLLYFLFIIVFYFYYNNYNNFGDCKAIIPSGRASVSEAKIVMVGDALIHGSVYTDARIGRGTYDFKPMLANIKPVIQKYDLAYYNQETILGGSSIPYSHYPRFNSPQEVGDAFIDCGFNMVSLANNHTMDKGEYGVIQSVNYWNSKNNVVTSGQWLSSEERNRVRIYEINGISYAFLSYTMWTNGLNTPSGKEYLNNVYSDELAKYDIDRVRDKVDVVMVAMHWGIEYSFNISDEQKRVAEYLSSLGVDLIIGSHPHVVEPVGYINNHKTFVIYSLGNALSGQIGVDHLTGLIAEVTIKKFVDSDGNKKVTIENPRADLLYTKYNSSYRNFKLYLYSQLNNDILNNYLSHYEKYKNIVGSSCPELQWGLSGV